MNHEARSDIAVPFPERTLAATVVSISASFRVVLPTGPRRVAILDLLGLSYREKCGRPVGAK
ncbi:MAG: hypothetical protein LBE85_03655 [Candidatus Accumulibacter sp.]|nr:hypothetical protein [Accumulibacter sp.]